MSDRPSRQRRLLIVTGLLGVRGVGQAQPAGAMRRVGILHVGVAAEATAMRAQFKQGMQDYGWSEGRNIEYLVAGADGDVKRLGGLAAEMVAQKVDVIFAGASLAVRAAQRVTKTIPIVMAGVGDPVGQGFAVSLARPGGNITGISNQGDELLSKQIQILHEAVPAAKRLAILLNETNPQGAALYRSAGQSACAALGLTAIWVVASTPAELAGAFGNIVSQRAQAVAVVADPMYNAERARLHELAQAARLPAAYGQPEHVVAGGLLSYASNYPANFRYAAKFVDRILRGTSPAELPIEQSTRFELVINQKAAKALGIVVPQALLLRADRVIE